MKVRIKNIIHERTEDAPFIGALICSIDCNINCKNCFNQHIKDLPTIVMDSQEIISQVLSNPFNKGIILAGLEWTLQPKEMKELIYLAIKNNLEVILYTGLAEEDFKNKFIEIYNIPNIYIKFDRYIEELKCENKMYGVKLASKNQKIIKTKGGFCLKINCVVDGEDVILPKYESICASGMDLRAWKYALPNNPKDVIDFHESGFALMYMDRVLIKTGLHIELPKNIEAQIRPRSGLALRHGITVLNTPGTIDEDYRGDIGVILINLSQKPFIIKKGDRIAQIVFQKVEKFNLEIVDKLSDTVRGEGGFDSTGTK